MKKLLLLLLLILIGCSQPVQDSSLIDKDGLMYLSQSTKPYTGEVVINYSSGETEYKGIYEEGILISESYLNKDGTEKEPLNYKLLTDVERPDEVHYLKSTNEIYSGPIFNIYGKSEGILKNGKFHGSVKLYYENGQLQKEMTWKNGKQVGLWKEYYENGQVQEEITYVYKDRKKRRTIKSYYDNGQLNEEQTWEDGKQYGAYKVYLPNGQLFLHHIYEDDKVVQKIR